MVGNVKCAVRAFFEKFGSDVSVISASGEKEMVRVYRKKGRLIEKHAVNRFHAGGFPAKKSAVFLMESMGVVPQKGSRFRYGGQEYEVRQMEEISFQEEVVYFEVFTYLN